MVEKWFMYHSEQMTLLSPCKDEKGRQLKTAFVYFTLKRNMIETNAFQLQVIKGYQHFLENSLYLETWKLMCQRVGSIIVFSGPS